MVYKTYFDNMEGIRAIFAKDHMWPSPANVYVVVDNRGFSIIDVGCGGLQGPEHLLGGLDHWGLDLEDLHTIVLTHAHPDHMGAMGWLLEKIRPKVLIHHLEVPLALDPGELINTFDIPLAERCCASAGKAQAFQGFDLLGYFDQSGCSMSAAEDVEELREGDIINLGDLTFEVIHTPGHAPGHISLFEKDRRLVLSGDVVGAIPAWYTPSSGGVIGYLKSLDKLEALEVEIILPAHGPIIKAPINAIRMIRERLLERDTVLVDSLKEGPKEFWDLNETLFQGPLTRFFPGCGITESHLIKLEREGVIQRAREKVVLIS